MRDGGKCVRCNTEVSLKTAHIDHINSGKLGTNSMSNLRTLCSICHITRGDYRHRGLIETAIVKGIIPAVGWRDLLWWEDED